MADDYTALYRKAKRYYTAKLGNYPQSGRYGFAVPRLTRDAVRDLQTTWNGETRRVLSSLTDRHGGGIETAIKMAGALFNNACAAAMLSMPLGVPFPPVEIADTFWDELRGLGAALTAAGMAPTKSSVLWESITEAVEEAPGRITDAIATGAAGVTHAIGDVTQAAVGGAATGLLMSFLPLLGIIAAVGLVGAGIYFVARKK